MTELKTNPVVLHALRVAASQDLTADEIQRQRVSFVMGALGRDSSVTRSHVQEVLNRREGRIASR